MGHISSSIITGMRDNSQYFMGPLQVASGFELFYFLVSTFAVDVPHGRRGFGSRAGLDHRVRIQVHRDNASAKQAPFTSTGRFVAVGRLDR